MRMVTTAIGPSLPGERVRARATRHTVGAYWSQRKRTRTEGADEHDSNEDDPAPDRRRGDVRELDPHLDRVGPGDRTAPGGGRARRAGGRRRGRQRREGRVPRVE